MEKHPNSSCVEDARPWAEGTASCVSAVFRFDSSTGIIYYFCLFVLLSLFPTFVTLELYDSRVEL